LLKGNHIGNGAAQSGPFVWQVMKKAAAKAVNLI